MRVRDLMSQHVCCCQPDATLNDAARIMWEHDCGAVPVVESSSTKHVIGMVTDRDIAMAAYLQGRPLDSRHVASVMSRFLATCKPEDTLESAEQTMASHHVRRLPVVDSEGDLVGLISIAHLARQVARGAGRDRQLAAQLGHTLSRICIARNNAAHEA